MSTGKNKERERRARVAQMQAAQRSAERRRSALIVGSAVLVGLAMIAAVAVPMVLDERKEAATAAAAKRPLKGVKEFTGLSKNHVETPVSYPQTPPVGGDHSGVWTNCGAYASARSNEQTVHSLEHGAVWIAYKPSLATNQVDTLTKLAEANSYVVLSPIEGLSEPVMASAWGKQLAVEKASDPRLAVFVQKYQLSPGAPEPGAPCTGGAGGMG